MTVTYMKARILILAIALSTVPSFAFAFGSGQDITSEMTVTASGTVTLSPALLGESIFTIMGWTDPGFDTNCFIKTTGFATPFSVTGCGAAGQQYRFDVTTTNTGTYPDGNLGSFYIFYDGYAYYAGSVSTGQTRVIATVPYHEATSATSTTFVLGSTVYIDASDFVEGMYVEQKYAYYFELQQAAVACRDCLYTTVTTPITHAGFSTTTATTSITRGGRYTLDTSIRVEGSIVGQFMQFLGLGQYGSSLSAATSTSFTAAEPNEYDLFVASTSAALAEYAGSSCSAWTGEGIKDCLNMVFIPQWEPIKASLTEFRDGFLAVWPLGYITRFEEIMWNADDVELPDIEIQMPNGTPAAGLSVNLAVTGALMSDDSIIGSATDPNSGLTLRDRIETEWSMFIYMLFIFAIVIEVLGLFRGHHKHV